MDARRRPRKEDPARADVFADASALGADAVVASFLSPSARVALFFAHRTKTYPEASRNGQTRGRYFLQEGS